MTNEEREIVSWGDKLDTVLGSVLAVLHKRQLTADEWRTLDSAQQFRERYREQMKPYEERFWKERQREQAAAVLAETEESAA